MRPVFHQKRVTSVHNLGQTVLVQTILLSTGSEIIAQLWVDPKSFQTVHARWEVLRAGEGLSTVSEEVPSLKGCVAYFGCGRAFRKALVEYPPVAAELFLGNVGALIQAETFLVSERGHPSMDAYVDYWKQFYAGSCRYYSHLDEVQRSWEEYVSARRPGTNLFNRIKTIAIDDCDNGLLFRASLSDSFHEMALSFRFDPAGETICDALGDIVRAPDQVCPGAAAFIGRLNGFKPHGALRDKISKILGEGQGCVHLIELAWEAVELLNDSEGGFRRGSFNDRAPEV
ncbi:MAG: DUF2889 domain-containing protein [Bacillota bacterium]